MSGGYGGYGGSYISPAVSGGGSKGSGSSQSQQSTQMVPGMMGVYNQLLGLNQQNYSNTLNAYNQGQNQLSGGLPSNYASYGQTLGGVGNTLGMGGVLGQNDNWGVAKPAYDAINNTFGKSQSDITQQLTQSGLGNTTYGGNLQTANATAKTQAIGGLGAQLAQTYAGYQAQEGNAASAAQMQGLGLQSGLSGAEGGALAGYHYANTAGSLTGNQGSASSQNTQQSTQGSTGPRQSPQTGGPAGITGGNGGTIGGGSSGGGPGSANSGIPGGPGNSSSGGGGYTPYSGNFSQTNGTPGYPGTTGITGGTQVGYQSLSGANQSVNAAANNGGFSQTGQPGQDMSGGLSPYPSGQGGGESTGAGVGGADATHDTVMSPSGKDYQVTPGVPSQPPGPGMKPMIAQGKNGPEIIGWSQFGASNW